MVRGRFVHFAVVDKLFIRIGLEWCEDVALKETTQTRPATVKKATFLTVLQAYSDASDSPTAAVELQNYFTDKVLEEGEVVFREGEEANAMYFVLEGAIIITKGVEEGQVSRRPS